MRVYCWCRSCQRPEYLAVFHPQPHSAAERPSAVSAPWRSRISAGKRKQSQAGFPSERKGFLVTSQGQFLLQALAAAVDVAAATERYAAACGTELQFTSEDLREIGLSTYTTGAK